VNTICSSITLQVDGDVMQPSVRERLNVAVRKEMLKLDSEDADKAGLIELGRRTNKDANSVRKLISVKTPLVSGISDC
jgi:hypothetical protein